MTAPYLPDELIAGRRALLSAVRALGPHARAVILVGAHAVQEWSGSVDLEIGFSPGSKDADLQIDLELLVDAPPLQDLMQAGGFSLGRHPGIWRSTEGQVDLLVAQDQRTEGKPPEPSAVSHDPRSVLAQPGLEGCLVLHETRTVTALAQGKPEQVELEVARPGPLIAAKAWKLGDRDLKRRETGRDRMMAKDALDILRLLRSQPLNVLAREFRVLEAHAMSKACVRTGVVFLKRLFVDGARPGSVLLRRSYEARGPEFDASLRELVVELLDAIE